MKSQKTLFIIFDNQGICLGEMFFDHDHFVQAFLRPEGELLLADWLADWQVVGLTHCQKRCSGNKAVCASGEHISLQSPEFPAALRAWLERHGFYSLVLHEADWQSWSMIRQLPLMPLEQMRLAQALSHCTSEQSQAFTASLVEMLNILESSSFHQTKTMVKLSKPSKPAKPSKSTKPSQSKKSTKPSQPQKPIKSAKPAKASKSSQPQKPVRSLKPIKPPQATVRSTKPKKPRKPVKLSKPVKSTKPIKHSSFRIGGAFVPSSGRGEKSPPTSTKNTKSVKKTFPIKPIKLSQPTSKPSKSKKPPKSAKPVKSTKSTKPAKKTISKKPAKLSKPSKSLKTLKQSKPKKPTKR